jgi:hypothetical protein
MYMVMLKGVTLHSTLQFNKEMLGEEAVNKFIDQLDDESRNVLSHIILDTSWYPFDCLINFTELVFNTILDKNEEALKKGSKLIVEKQIMGIYKTLLALGTAESIIKRINSINERYYQGVEVKTEYLGTNKLKVTYEGFEKKHRLHEIITMAWWEVVFENLDAKNISTNITTSLTEDKGYFEFIITWEIK